MYAFPLTDDFEDRRWRVKGLWEVDNAKPLPDGKLAVGQGAIGEIKPHTASGIRAGLSQLYSRSLQFPNAPLWLITYVALGADGKPIRRGRASAVAIYARKVKWPSRPRATKDSVVRAPELGDLYTVGTKSLRALIPYPHVDEPGFFGQAVERDVRAHVFSKATREAYSGTGGSLPGPDLRWHELAALYGELARLMADPLFAEIADELRMFTA